MQQRDIFKGKDLSIKAMLEPIYGDKLIVKPYEKPSQRVRSMIHDYLRLDFCVADYNGSQRLMVAHLDRAKFAVDTDGKRLFNVSNEIQGKHVVVVTQWETTYDILSRNISVSRVDQYADDDDKDYVISKWTAEKQKRPLVVNHTDFCKFSDILGANDIVLLDMPWHADDDAFDVMRGPNVYKGIKSLTIYPVAEHYYRYEFFLAHNEDVIEDVSIKELEYYFLETEGVKNFLKTQIV